MTAKEFFDNQSSIEATKSIVDKWRTAFSREEMFVFAEAYHNAAFRGTEVFWISVETKLPEKIKYHKCSEYVIATDGTKSVIAYWCYGINKWGGYYNIEKMDIIAWMPLPNYQ